MKLLGINFYREVDFSISIAIYYRDVNISSLIAIFYRDVNFCTSL